MASLLLCQPFTALGLKDYTYKIDSSLLEIMNDLDNNDIISVSLWLEDIDSEELQEQVLNEVKDDIENDVVSIYKAKGNEKRTLALLKEEADKDMDELKSESISMQKVIKKERQLSKKMQTKKNNKIIDELFDENNEDIIYVSKFAPNVDIYVTKEEIYDIIKSDEVEYIYYYDEDVVFEVEETMEESSTATTDEYDDSYFKATNLTTTRDAFGLTGYGVNVGIYDASFSLYEDVDYFERNNIAGTLIEDDSLVDSATSSHGNKVASIIGGYKYNEDGDVIYTGAACNSNMYWTAGYGYKESIEYLIENGCNVINMSLSYYKDNNKELNIYAPISAWFDHVSTYHNVHLVFCAGNVGANGVAPSANCHNAIIVGACTNDGGFTSFSSYVTEENDIRGYRPDLVAPGYRILTPAFSSYSSGTSFSAPMVTSAVAQFCQASAVLRYNPTLMKALVLACTRRTNNMIDNNIDSVSNSISVAFDRRQGCGILNTADMYTSFFSYKRYQTGTLSETDTIVNFTKTISSRYAGYEFRCVAVWDYVTNISGEHAYTGATETENDVFLLTITEPDGETLYSTVLYNDTKAMVSFVPTSTGSFTFTLQRIVNSGQEINYSIVWNCYKE